MMTLSQSSTLEMIMGPAVLGRLGWLKIIRNVELESHINPPSQVCLSRSTYVSSCIMSIHLKLMYFCVRLCDSLLANLKFAVHKAIMYILYTVRDLLIVSTSQNHYVYAVYWMCLNMTMYCVLSGALHCYTFGTCFH